MDTGACKELVKWEVKGQEDQEKEDEEGLVDCEETVKQRNSLNFVREVWAVMRCCLTQNKIDKMRHFYSEKTHIVMFQMKHIST